MRNKADKFKLLQLIYEIGTNHYTIKKWRTYILAYMFFKTLCILNSNGDCFSVTAV